jgi:hypothetical protein
MKVMLSSFGIDDPAELDDAFIVVERDTTAGIFTVCLLSIFAIARENSRQNIQCYLCSTRLF